MLNDNTPIGNYMFKVSNRGARPSCEICSKLTTKAPERRHWRYFVGFIVTFEHISHLVLEFLLLTLVRWTLAGTHVFVIAFIAVAQFFPLGLLVFCFLPIMLRLLLLYFYKSIFSNTNLGFHCFHHSNNWYRIYCEATGYWENSLLHTYHRS